MATSSRRNGPPSAAQPRPAVGQGLLKLEKYYLAPGLSINFFFGFNDSKMGRTLVQAK